MILSQLSPSNPLQETFSYLIVDLLNNATNLLRDDYTVYNLTILCTNEMFHQFVVLI